MPDVLQYVCHCTFLPCMQQSLQQLLMAAAGVPQAADMQHMNTLKLVCGAAAFMRTCLPCCIQ